ncbi:MAG: DUF1153 domain-containing protein [Alphaproteobacteria bacterium]|jgi:hypothetical protein|nr:DUF1153 domain-containing protein [Alphaproteobacteria bacterium]
MGRDGRNFVDVITGPDGRPVRMVQPPPANLKRWSARRKAEVVTAVRGGMLSLEDACHRYALTVEEFLSWESAIHQYGLSGLRVAEIQHHRHAH